MVGGNTLHHSSSWCCDAALSPLTWKNVVAVLDPYMMVASPCRHIARSNRCLEGLVAMPADPGELALELSLV